MTWRVCAGPKMANLYPQFPLYIPSKGRSEYMMTSKALTQMGVKHHVVVEPQEVDAYQKAIKDMKLCATVLPLDMSYKEKYELCDNLGLTKSTGPGPARNFAWDHSISEGHAWHWVMDDNIRSFKRLHKKMRVKVISPSFFSAMEDFVLRYKNVSMAGPNYAMFAFSAAKIPPFVTNTRIYSCNLIRNNTGFRWRGRYNEDTILSLDMLTKGWCTIQFYAFLQEKMGTQVLKGGNTQEFYHAEGKVRDGQKYADTGTLAKSRMLEAVYPQYCRVVKKYSRIHHEVNYRPFRRLKLIRRDDIAIKTGVVNYGMTLKKIK
jgi:hypothetical protein